MTDTQSTPHPVVRRSADRGHADHGWLQAKHSFSFAGYYDPDHVSYRSLRVINEDRIAAGRGFPTHPHESMEIFTYVISGELQHEDSMGNGRTIQAGEFQYMSAGSGVLHSESNPSDEATHLLQIWITPATPGGAPRYADLKANTLKKNNALTLLASGEATSGDKSGAIEMRQQAEIHFGKIDAGQSLHYAWRHEYPYIWLQMIKGRLNLNDTPLEAGDGVAIDHTDLQIEADTDAEFLLFTLS